MAQRGSGFTDSNYSGVGPSRQRSSRYEALASERKRDRGAKGAHVRERRKHPVRN